MRFQAPLLCKVVRVHQSSLRLKMRHMVVDQELSFERVIDLDDGKRRVVTMTILDPIELESKRATFLPRPGQDVQQAL